MSDPVTNVDIEDVLSSIRRLVSDDTRARPVGWGDPQGDGVTAQDALTPEVGRLVLTPALRVDAAPSVIAIPSVEEQDLARQDEADPAEAAGVYVLRDSGADIHGDGDGDGDGQADDQGDVRAADAASPQDHGRSDSKMDGGIEDAAESQSQERPFVLAEDEAFLDEETLRDMVAEIVRQELQGALGERITRNVRKLVRREIQRALMSHELE
jgi:cell pole-organizing protein PopZ